MRGRLKIEHIRGNEVIDTQEVSNMATDVFNKMIYDLFYASSSTVYNSSSMLYYDMYNRVLTLPRLSMYLSSGVESDRSASHPPSILSMTSGLKGSSVCSDNYLVSVGAGGSSGLTITAEFNNVEGAVRSVGLCIPRDNNYNCNRSNRLYDKELGLVLNHDDYMRYHSEGLYSNLVKFGNKVVFLHIDVETKFGSSYYGGTYLYEITEDGLLSVIRSYNTLSSVTPTSMVGINRVALIPQGDGYTLLVSGTYTDGNLQKRTEVMKVEFDSDFSLTGRVVRTGIMLGAFMPSNLEYTAQVVKTGAVHEGLGVTYVLYANGRGDLMVGRATEGYINAIVGGVQTSIGMDAVKISTILSDSELFDLFNGTYTSEGNYKTLSGILIDLESVYNNNGKLPSLKNGEGDYLISRMRVGDKVVGIIHPNNPFLDKDINMIKDSVNVSIDKPRLIIGKSRSLLTNARTDGVINVKSGDTLRVSYNILV